MPEHGGLLAGGGNGRVVAILIAIGAGKDDDAKFHSFILTSQSNGNVIGDRLLYVDVKEFGNW
jgi:hypothetical protein